MKRNTNRPRRREPYLYTAAPEEYRACIRQALEGGRVPLYVLQMVYHVLLPYMHT